MKKTNDDAGKKVKKPPAICIILLCMILLGGQYGTNADEPVWEPSLIMAANKIGDEAAKLKGSAGVILVVHNAIGEEFSKKIIRAIEAILKINHRHITLLNSDKARRELALSPNKFLDQEEAKKMFPLLGDIGYIIAGKLDDDGNFRVYGYPSDGGSGGGSFEIEITFTRDEIFRLITNESIPPIYNTRLVPISGEIYDSAYDKTGDFAAITTRGGALYEFDTHRKRLEKTHREHGPLARIVYGHGGEILLAEDTGFLRIIGKIYEKEIKVADDPLFSIACSDRGKIYIGFTRGIVVYDLGRGTRIATFEDVSGPVQQLFLSGDEKTVIAQDARGIGFWDASTGKKINSINGNFTAFAIDRQGQYVATATAKSNILYSAKTRERYGPLGQSSDSTTTSLTFSPEGHYLLTGNQSGMVNTWQLNKGVQMYHLENHLGPVATVSYRGDGRQFLSGGGDQLFFYDAQGEPSATLRIKNNTEDTIVTINNKTPEEGSKIAGRTEKIFYNIPVGSARVTVQSPHNVVIASSGQRSAPVSITKTGGSIVLITAPPQTLDLDSNGRMIGTSVSKTSDGLLLITHNASPPTKSEPGNAPIVLLNVHSGISTLLGATDEGHRKQINDSSLLHGKIITAAEDGIWIWQDNKPTILDLDRADNISISDDGKYMVSSSKQESKLWEWEGLTLLRKFPGEKALFHQGAIIAVNGIEITRSTLAGHSLPVFPAEGSNETTITIPQGIRSVRAGYDNAVLVSRSDGVVELRNAGAGTPLAVPGNIAIQNAQSIFSAQSNGNILQFDSETGRQGATIFAHSREINDMLFFTPNQLASTSRDGLTMIYDIDSGKEVGRFAIYTDKQKTYINTTTEHWYGDRLHVLRSGKRL